MLTPVPVCHGRARCFEPRGVRGARTGHPSRLRKEAGTSKSNRDSGGSGGAQNFSLRESSDSRLRRYTSNMLFHPALLLLSPLVGYHVELLPYSYSAANNTGDVLLSTSNHGQYNYWLYKNGAEEFLAGLLPSDKFSTIDDEGNIYGVSEMGEVLRYRTRNLKPFVNNLARREVLGTPLGHPANLIYGGRPDIGFYAIIDHLCYLAPDFTWIRIGNYDSQGGNSTLASANCEGQATGSSESYISGYTNWAVYFQFGGATNISKDMHISGYHAGGVSTSKSGIVAVIAGTGEYTDSPIKSYLWRHPGDYNELPGGFGTNQTVVSSVNDAGTAVGTCQNYLQTPVPVIWNGGTVTDFRTISDIAQYGFSSISLRRVSNDGTIIGYGLLGSTSQLFIARP